MSGTAKIQEMIKPSVQLEREPGETGSPETGSPERNTIEDVTPVFLD